VDADGAALGVVSFKLASVKVEGIAFAIPISEALRALNLKVGSETGPLLLDETAEVEERASVAAFVDKGDPVPSLDPEGDRMRAAEKKELREREQREAERAAAEADRRRRTPWFIPAMKWGGVALAGAGVIGAIATSVQYNSSTTTLPQFESLRTWNTAAWTGAGVGAACFALSFVLEPIVLKKSALQVSPTGVRWQGAF
jgi:hypothetical protein